MWQVGRREGTCIMEYGKIVVNDFADGVRSMRRLSDSIDQVFKVATRYLKNFENIERKEVGEWTTALEWVTKSVNLDERIHTAEIGAVVYTTSGGLKFGWTVSVSPNRVPFARNGEPQFKKTFEFRVYAKNEKFREGSKLRAALYGAGWEIVEEKPEAVLPEVPSSLLDEEPAKEMLSVLAKYPANLVDE